MKFANAWLCLIVLVTTTVSGWGAEPVPAKLTDAERAAAYANLSPVADRYVLDDEAFPNFKLSEPELTRELLGDYQLNAKVYGPDYGVVTSAMQPGRYGVVIEITPEADRKLATTRRFLTLFRLPKGKRLGPQNAEAALDLAAQFEVPPGESPASFYHQAAERDRQWWVGLKRRLYGFDKQFPQPFRSPMPIEGAPARVVREGTLAEAGMKPDTTRQLDELLSTWAADSDTGFDVCIVRHGVIVLHKAYGQRQGKPLTTESMTHLTSTSKMITAAMLLQLVDQGWLKLDEPITTLPGPLHDLPTQKPVTLRAMYTHTAFVGGLHPLRDMEERLAQVLPHLPIGEGYQYTSTSLEMAWAIASLETGKSISTFARDHLLQPLGCERTEVFNTGGSTQSTSLDMARICQMLLNRGAYGDKRYFSEQTFAAMLPQRLTKTLGPYTNDRVWGFGAHPQKIEGLSHFTFGHGGYFRSTNFIDPVNDLVVVMLRIGEGTNYAKYHPQFLKLLVDGLVDRVPEFPQTLTMMNLIVPAGEDRVEIEAVVENPGPAAVLEYRYETAGTNWKFSPATARIELPPQSRVPVKILAQMDPERLSPLPMLRGQVFAAAGPTPPAPAIEYWLRPVLKRSVTARRLKQPPRIDGVIGKEEFGADAEEQHLLETHGRKVPLKETRFVAGYDDRAVYFAVTAAEESPRTIPRLAKLRDDPLIGKEDYVEVALDLIGDGKPPRRFAVNLDGLQFDALEGDAEWNADWKACVSLEDNQCVVEFAIPHAALGTDAPQPGEKWALNILRGRSTREPKWERYAQWVMTYADFKSSTHLGTLQF